MHKSSGTLPSAIGEYSTRISSLIFFHLLLNFSMTMRRCHFGFNIFFVAFDVIIKFVPFFN